MKNRKEGQRKKSLSQGKVFTGNKGFATNVLMYLFIRIHLFVTILKTKLGRCRSQVGHLSSRFILNFVAKLSNRARPPFPVLPGRGGTILYRCEGGLVLFGSVNRFYY